jgi:putative tryptophan/tyrosine transport system substrate-binding protein
VNRRHFITLLGGAAAWPLAARAQQQAMPVIGYLSSLSPEGNAPRQAAFRVGLSEQGFVEGRNVAVEYRFANGQYERLPAMAEELARRSVAVIVAVGGEPSPVAAKAATSTIPIVFVMGSDRVQVGLVARYNRPGGNATGMNLFTDTLGAKRLGLLHELAPHAATVGFLNNPRFPKAQNQLRDAQEAARVLGLTLRILSVSTEQEIDAAFAIIAQERIGALSVGADPFLTTVGRDRIIAAAAHARVPAIYEFREQTAAGGLMSYGIDVADVYRQIGVCAGRILKGEKPGDLPVVQPTKFEFVINIRAAKKLDLDVPPMLVARADEVIE